MFMKMVRIEKIKRMGKVTGKQTSNMKKEKKIVRKGKTTTAADKVR